MKSNSDNTRKSFYSLPEIESFFSIAFDLAKEAFQANEVPVAAVVVYHQEVIAAERNRICETKNPLAHAEMLAINKASKILQNERLNECELFTTLEPCTMCSGASILARLNFVHFLATNENLFSFCDILESEKFNHYPGWQYYTQFQNSSKLLSQFFEQKRQIKEGKKK